MKKLLSLVLAFVMVCSLSVSAFAEEGTTPITATVPEDAPVTYTIHVPSTTNIPYGTTDWVEVNGTAYVTGVKNLPEGKQIWFRVKTTNLEDEFGNVIPTKYKDELEHELTDSGRYGCASWKDGMLNPNPDYYYFFYVRVPSWEGAVPGTYTATMTFSFFVD